MWRLALLIVVIAAADLREANATGVGDDWCRYIAAYDGALQSTTVLLASARQPDDASYRLRPTAQFIIEGGNVAQALAEQKFLPDQANLEIVQYLNPQIPDINFVKPGEMVFLPALEKYDGKRWSNYLPEAPLDGYRAENFYSQKLRLGIELQSKSLQ